MNINPLDLVPGVIFGFAMNRGRVVEPSIIVGQMNLSHFVMMKMFLAALGSSLLVFAYMYQTKKIDAARAEQICSRKNPGVNTVILGTAILGAGMAISGSCPGSVYAQLGSFSFYSLFTLIGCLMGAFAHAMFIEANGIQQIEQKSGFSMTTPMATKNNQMYKIINQLKPDLQLDATKFCGAAGIALLAMCFLLELIVNWRKDLAGLYPESFDTMKFFWYATPAMFSGILIGGIAQYLSLNLRNAPLGVSRTFTEILQLGYKVAIQQLPNPQHKQLLEQNVPKSIKSPEQEPMPLTAIAMFVGSLIATLTSLSISVGLSAVDFQIPAFVFILRCLIGGAMITFGALLAGGCTSGIGLSGSGSGSTVAFLGTGVMFGAAIITGMLLTYPLPTLIVIAAAIGAVIGLADINQIKAVLKAGGPGAGSATPDVLNDATVAANNAAQAASNVATQAQASALSAIDAVKQKVPKALE